MTTTNTALHPMGGQLAAIYARVSTKEQNDQGYSIPTQLEACLALAEREGYLVPPEYIFKDDYTGRSLNRPELPKLRALVRSQSILAVISYEIDRLSRNLAHQILLREECMFAQVKLRLVKMPELTDTAESQLMANLWGSFAEYERVKILERTERGRRGRAQAGYPPASVVPLGYRYVKQVKGGLYVIDEEEAALVRRIFSLYVDAGYSTKAIAQLLTKERVPTQRDRRGKGPKRKFAPGVWHPGSIYDIVTNEAYIGVVYDNKRERQPHPDNPDKKTRWRLRPREEWTPIPVPRIIDQALFDAAQAQRQINAQESSRNQKYDYLLGKSRLRCARCKCSMSGQCQAKTGWRFYRCNRFPHLTDTPCRAFISAKQIETRVWKALEAAIQDPEMIADGIRTKQQEARLTQAEIDQERSAFLAQIAQCEKEVQKWEQAYLDDVIEGPELKDKKAAIALRHRSAAEELVRLDALQRTLDALTIDLSAIDTYCRRIREKLTEPVDSEKKRLIFQAFHLKASWHPETDALELSGLIPLEDIATNSERCG
jgi:site-specific DNA recombinase